MTNLLIFGHKNQFPRNTTDTQRRKTKRQHQQQRRWVWCRCRDPPIITRAARPVGPRGSPSSTPLTSNCQWAAWRSCFAWSAAQPAVKTNWLIMTWCRSSSIFTDMIAAPLPRLKKTKTKKLQQQRQSGGGGETKTGSGVFGTVRAARPCVSECAPPFAAFLPSKATTIFSCHHQQQRGACR